MLRSILDLAEVDVSEIMTHRRNVVTVDADLPIQQLVDQGCWTAPSPASPCGATTRTT